MGSLQYSKRLPQRTYVRKKRSRLKTFKSEEAAKAYASAQGIKNYELVNLKTDENVVKKIRVIVK